MCHFSHCTFMVCAGSAGIRIWWGFCQMCRNSANAPHFRDKRCCNLPQCAAFYHKSVALLPLKCSAFGGRKRDLHHFFKYRRTTFVAFFLMRTVLQKNFTLYHVSFVSVQSNTLHTPSHSYMTHTHTHTRTHTAFEERRLEQHTLWP